MIDIIANATYICVPIALLLFYAALISRMRDEHGALGAWFAVVVAPPILIPIALPFVALSSIMQSLAQIAGT
jgi:hypothetical protein